MNRFYIIKNNELYHYGTKGQKRGIRNYQNEDGSYTDKGQAENNGHGRYSSANENSEFKEINNKDTFIKLTDEQKKRLLYGAAGAAIALGIGAVVYVNVKNNINPITGDMTIKAGELIQRISPSDEKDLHEAFYAAVDKKDKLRYEKMLPAHYMQRMLLGVEGVNKKEYFVNNELKIAGHDTCEKIYKELISDLRIRNDLKLLGINNYDQFNQNQVRYWDPSYSSIYDKFHNILKQKGYAGFLDINDQKYSGYSAKAPVILFNNSNNFNLKNSTQIRDFNNIGDILKTIFVSSIETNKAIGEHYLKEIANDPINTATVATLAGLGGGYLGVKVYDEKEFKKYYKQ